MRSPDAPAAATWLLRQLGCSPKNESLIGDLVEEYRRGRSRVWYWRQVLIAIGASLLQEIRAQRRLAVRALVTGWALVFLFFWSVWVPLFQFLRRMLPASWSTVRWVYVRGWIVPNGIAVLMVVLSCIGGLCLGWVIARLHRPQQRTAILTFVASWFVSLLPVFLFVLGKTLHDWSLPNWRYDNPFFLVFGVAGNILAMLSTMLGGLESTGDIPNEIAFSPRTRSN